MLTIEKPRAVFGGHARPRWRLAIIIRVPNYFEYARIGGKRQTTPNVGGRRRSERQALGFETHGFKSGGLFYRQTLQAAFTPALTASRMAPMAAA